jgi:hypothetical protein
MKTRFYVSKFRPEMFGVFTETELYGITENLIEARKLVPINYQRMPFDEMGKSVEHIMISNREKLENEEDILEYYEKKHDSEL